MEKCAEGSQTVILSTHLIQEAAKLIGHAVIIKNGKILRDSDADELSGAAYQVSGPASLVDSYLRGRHVLSVNSLGGLKTACVEGVPDERGSEGLEFSGMDLQDYFIGLMNEQEGVK